MSVPGDGEDGTYAIDTFDIFNQMLSVSDNDSVSAFSYNAEGLRLGKTVTEDDETTTTVFAYEYSKAVLELDENGDETAYNVYGGDMLISRTTASDGTLYYLYNGHGDVVQLTDSNGTVVMTYDYDAFGVVTEATGTITNSYMFCGYMYDEETGMYYLNSRYYDPVAARFMSADTYLGQQTDPLSLNLYTYCHNEPLMNYDPTGHWTITYEGSSAILTPDPPDITYSDDGKTAHFSVPKEVITEVINHSASNDLPIAENADDEFLKSTDTVIGQSNYGQINNNENNDIRQMQWLLFKLGYYKGLYGSDYYNVESIIDGEFSRNTLEALIRFQLLFFEWENLFDEYDVYGGCGPSTSKKLTELYKDYLADPSNFLIYDGSRDALVDSLMTQLDIDDGVVSLSSSSSGGNTGGSSTGNWAITVKQLELMGFSDFSQQSADDLNYVLNNFGFTTIEQVQYFLAQCLFEGGRDKDHIENNQNNWNGSGYDYHTYRCFKIQDDQRIIGVFDPDKQKFWGYDESTGKCIYVGAGYIQLTGDYNYSGFYNWMKNEGLDKPDILNVGATYVASNYAWLASGFWWDDNDMNSFIANHITMDKTELLRMVSNGVNWGNKYTSNEPYGWEGRKTAYATVIQYVY